MSERTIKAEEEFCPNEKCPERGKLGGGNIIIHDRQRGRCYCKTCKKTFSIRQGTMFHRLQTAEGEVTKVITLLAHGCPKQAVVQAFGYDERTIDAWEKRAGKQCEQVHEALIGQGQLALEHVQVDEIRVKLRGMVVWMALAIMVSSRLWLGGVVQESRNRSLARRILGKVAACAACSCNLLVMVDGWAAYPKAIQNAFRCKEPRQGRQGRSRLLVWPTLAIAQVIKHTTPLFTITRTILRGTPQFVAQQLCLSKGGIQVNTAFIERLNASFRERLAVLTRRGRHPVASLPPLHAKMYLLGAIYNFCTFHHELRLPNFDDPDRPHWTQRTPAMAASLTNHAWSVHELLSCKIPPPPFIPPKRLGRPPKSLLISPTI